ncbi:hypothetical protein CKQ90_35595, partial [Klebsiella pneumoniae]
YPGERHQHHHADLSWGLGEPHSLPRRPDAYLGRFPALLGGLTQANVTNTTMLIYPGVSVNRTRSRGGLMPTWG